MTENIGSAAQALLRKAEDRSAVFGVVGLGYVGLPLAVEIAAAGYRVVGFDVKDAVVNGVNQGRSHIQDVPTKRLAPLVRDKKITATQDAAALGGADAIYLISLPCFFCL